MNTDIESLKFKGTVEEVEYLLSKYPEAKNNDFYLQWLWLKEIESISLPDIPWRKFQELAGKMGCQESQTEDSGSRKVLAHG